MFGGRYIIFMMGCFSIYTGFIYNDVFSKSFNIYGSRFHVGNVSQTAIFKDNEAEWTLDPGSSDEYDGTPYPIGIDPIWQVNTIFVLIISFFFVIVIILLGRNYKLKKNEIV